MEQIRAATTTATSWTAYLAAGGALVALMLLIFFYSIVATAVDRGERAVFAHDQSDIDEDLRTPAGSVLVVRAASPR